MTTPVGLTLTGIRSAKSAGATYNGRRRVRSSAIRALGGTPVARDGLVRFGLGEPVAQLPIQINVVEEAALFEERALDPADEIFDAPFGIGRALHLVMPICRKFSPSRIPSIRCTVRPLSC